MTTRYIKAVFNKKIARQALHFISYMRDNETPLEAVYRTRWELFPYEYDLTLANYEILDVATYVRNSVVLNARITY